MKPGATLKTMRLKNELVEKVKIQADKENRNFSNMVESILMEYFKNKKQ